MSRRPATATTVPTTDPLPTPPRGWRVADVARSLRIPRSSVYRLIASGELAAVRFSGRSVVILEADLAAFLDARRTGAGR